MIISKKHPGWDKSVCRSIWQKLNLWGFRIWVRAKICGMRSYTILWNHSVKIIGKSSIRKKISSKVVFDDFPENNWKISVTLTFRLCGQLELWIWNRNKKWLDHNEVQEHAYAWGKRIKKVEAGSKSFEIVQHSVFWLTCFFWGDSLGDWLVSWTKWSSWYKSFLLVEWTWWWWLS